MPEFLYATSHLAGDFLNPNNALGNTPSTWAGTVNTNVSETSRWAIGNPSDPLTAGGTQTFRVWARKGSNSGNPSVSFYLYVNGSLVQQLGADETITSTTGQLIARTINTSAITDKDNVEIEVASNMVGGNANTRNSAQISHIEWEADVTAVVPTDQTVDTNSVAVDIGTLVTSVELVENWELLDDNVTAPTFDDPDVQRGQSYTYLIEPWNESLVGPASDPYTVEVPSEAADQVVDTDLAAVEVVALNTTTQQLVDTTVDTDLAVVEVAALNTTTQVGQIEVLSNTVVVNIAPLETTTQQGETTVDTNAAGVQIASLVTSTQSGDVTVQTDVSTVEVVALETTTSYLGAWEVIAEEVIDPEFRDYTVEYDSQYEYIFVPVNVDEEGPESDVIEIVTHAETDWEVIEEELTEPEYRDYGVEYDSSYEYIYIPVDVDLEGPYSDPIEVVTHPSTQDQGVTTSESRIVVAALTTSTQKGSISVSSNTSVVEVRTLQSSVQIAPLYIVTDTAVVDVEALGTWTLIGEITLTTNTAVVEVYAPQTTTEAAGQVVVVTDSAPVEVVALETSIAITGEATVQTNAVGIEVHAFDTSTIPGAVTVTADTSVVEVGTLETSTEEFDLIVETDVSAVAIEALETTTTTTSTTDVAVVTVVTPATTALIPSQGVVPDFFIEWSTELLNFDLVHLLLELSTQTELVSLEYTTEMVDTSQVVTLVSMEMVTEITDTEYQYIIDRG